MLGFREGSHCMDATRPRKVRKRTTRILSRRIQREKRTRRILRIRKLGFGPRHFRRAQLGDKRRTKRLIQTADQMISRPGGTLPKMMNKPAMLDAFYRLCNHSKVTHAAVMDSHVAGTRERVAAHDGVLLFIHDTSELDYTGLKSIADMGRIGNGSCRGYLCHNSLAVDPATRETLGLTSQILHTRREVPENETPEQRRNHPQRESRLWKIGCQASAAAPGKMVIDVCDAGADAFELLDFEHTTSRHYIIRASKDRVLGEEASAAETEQVHQKLYAYTRQLPDLGGRYVQIRDNTNQRNGKNAKVRQTARVAKVRIAAAPVIFPVPEKERGEHGDKPLSLWVVHVREVEPAANEPLLEWVLLTNLPADTLEQAARIVDYYSCRPIVEEYHKAMKTGAGVENLQFTSKQALEPAIALLSVVAVTLLQLREAARRPDATTRRATEVVPKLHVKVLSVWRHGKVKMDMSIHDFYLALARMGGHQNRKSDGPPGWLTLWRGWYDLHLMVTGATIHGDERSEET
jgi:hypothetical protein